VPAVRLWVGVISPDLKYACVTLSGDTLFVLDRRIISAEQMQTWWLMYRIDTRTCHWIPLARDD
jgi:hypothetical protein